MRRFVRAERNLVHALRFALAGAALGALDEPRPEALTLPVRMHDADPERECISRDEVAPAEGAQVTVLLVEPAVGRKLGSRKPFAQVADRQLRWTPVIMLLVGNEQREHRLVVVRRRRPAVHARPSSASPSPVSVCSSTSGSGSASSPSRLIHTVRNPSRVAGAMSW